ncbi:hypothetical protein [Parabacteroides bouchesdurhonensis]|nr:hypothetical protein [Parabacteroides bouchesdurhonensis]
MKKKLFSIATIAIIAVAAAWNFNENKNDVTIHVTELHIPALI